MERASFLETTEWSGTIQMLIDNYTERILRPKITELYGYTKDKEFLRGITKQPCWYMKQITNETVGLDSKMGACIISLNSTLKSTDIEYLKTSNLYNHLLKSGQKPYTKEEEIYFVEEVQKVLVKNFLTIVDSLSETNLQNNNDGATFRCNCSIL